jgi:hypothetical protein
LAWIGKRNSFRKGILVLLGWTEAAYSKDDALTRLTARCILAPDALPGLKPLLAAFDKTLTRPKKYAEGLAKAAEAVPVPG